MILSQGVLEGVVLESDGGKTVIEVQRMLDAMPDDEVELTSDGVVKIDTDFSDLNVGERYALLIGRSASGELSSRLALSLNDGRFVDGISSKRTSGGSDADAVLTCFSDSLGLEGIEGRVEALAMGSIETDKLYQCS